jgi:hypothetical protein
VNCSERSHTRHLQNVRFPGSIHLNSLSRDESLGVRPEPGGHPIVLPLLQAAGRCSQPVYESMPDSPLKGRSGARNHWNRGAQQRIPQKNPWRENSSRD